MNKQNTTEITVPSITDYKKLTYKMQENTNFRHYLKMHYPVHKTYFWKQIYHNVLEQARLKGKKKIKKIHLLEYVKCQRNITALPRIANLRAF